MIILSGILGFILWEYSFLSTYFGLMIVLLGTYCILGRPDPSGKYPLIFSSYMIGIEVLLRMTEAGLFWEFGKYSIIYFLILGFIRRRRKIKFFTPILYYFLLLLPAVFLLPLNSFNLWRQDIAFNLSGPACLTLCSIYFYNRTINKEMLETILLYLVLPIVSMAIFNILMMPDLAIFQFMPYSNPTTSGGYGPNQVSTIFGIGIALLVTAQVIKLDLFGSKYITVALIILFMALGLITFSRGGILAAIISISLSVSYYFFRDQKKTQLISKTIFILIVTCVTWITLVSITEGVITNRYGFSGGLYGEKFLLDLTGRVQIYEIDLNIFSDHFFTGVGPGQASDLREQYGYSKRVAAHIEYSRMLAEHGILGLISLLILVLVPVYQFLSTGSVNGKYIKLLFGILAILTLSHSAMRISVSCFLYGLLFPKYID